MLISRKALFLLGIFGILALFAVVTCVLSRAEGEHGANVQAHEQAARVAERSADAHASNAAIAMTGANILKKAAQDTIAVATKTAVAISPHNATAPLLQLSMIELPAGTDPRVSDLVDHLHGLGKIQEGEIEKLNTVVLEKSGEASDLRVALQEQRIATEEAKKQGRSAKWIGVLTATGGILLALLLVLLG